MTRPLLDKIEIIKPQRITGVKIGWTIDTGNFWHGSFKTEKEAVKEAKARIKKTIQLLQNTLKKLEEK